MRAIVAVVYLCGFGLGYFVSVAVRGGPVGLVVGASVTLAFQYGLYHVQRSSEAAAARRRLRQELVRARVCAEGDPAGLMSQQVDAR